MTVTPWPGMDGPSSGGGAWPDDWNDQEIEAKWTTDEATLEQLKVDFPRDESIFWVNTTPYRSMDVAGEAPRRYTDIYYDYDDADLERKRGHATFSATKVACPLFCPFSSPQK